MLPTMEYRKIRGDAITTFKAVSNVGSPIRLLFSISVDFRTRGHLFKLQKENFRTRSRQFFLPNRIFNTWNSTPSHIVQSTSVANFKIAFDAFQTDQFSVQSIGNIKIYLYQKQIQFIFSQYLHCSLGITGHCPLPS